MNPASLVTYKARRALLAQYRASIAITIDGYPATVCGLENTFATVATINGPAIRAEFSWQSVARILANGGNFRSM